MGLFGKNRIFDRTEKLGAGMFQAAGKTIACPHCGHTHFEPSTRLLNTPGMTFFDLDWANRTATVLICQNCSQIQWFLETPQKV